MLDYLAEHPPIVDILAAAYNVKSSYKKPQAVSVDQKDFEQAFTSTSSLWGQVPGQAPDDFKSAVEFANGMLEQMKKGKAN